MSKDTSWERKGLDMLLATYPEADLIVVSRTDPWVSVDLMLGNYRRSFAIWRNTGCVYEVGSDGAVIDDPILIPEGSPYKVG